MCIVAVHAPKTKGGKSKCSSRVNSRQMSLLKAAFANSFFPNKTTLMMSAQQIGLNEQRVNHWFVCRRNIVRQKIKEGAPSINDKRGKLVEIVHLIHIRN